MSAGLPVHIIRERQQAIYRAVGLLSVDRPLRPQANLLIKKQQVTVPHRAVNQRLSGILFIRIKISFTLKKSDDI
jgi:hypothetical protein